MLTRYIKLYCHMFKLNIRSKLEYKADFIIGVCTNLPLQIVEFLFIWVIFQNISSLNGWSFYEMSLIYGIMITCKGLTDMFFDNVYEVCKGYVRQGTFDIMLIQPINIIFNILAKDFYLAPIGGVILGIILIAVSISNLVIVFGILELLLLILFILFGTLIFGGLLLLATVSALWFVESLDFVWSVYVVHQFGLYPLGVYNTFVKVLITCIFPYAFASYFPATYLLGKEDGNMAFLSPVIAIIIWFMAIKAWKFALKRYKSTGS